MGVMSQTATRLATLMHVLLLPVVLAPAILFITPIWPPPLRRNLQRMASVIV